jgi:biopolymer transport protein ExbD
MHGESAAQLNSKFSSGLGSKRCKVEDPEFDVTAMVDLVSLMNIYFLVSWVVAMSNEVDLPAAKNVVSGDPETAVMVIVKKGDERGSSVIVGEDASGEVLTDRTVILQRVTDAVKAGVKDAKRKDTLIIKAEREVPLKDISHIASATSAVEGMSLRLAVFEKEGK